MGRTEHKLLQEPIYKEGEFLPTPSRPFSRPGWCGQEARVSCWGCRRRKRQLLPLVRLFDPLNELPDFGVLGVDLKGFPGFDIVPELGEDFC